MSKLVTFRLSPILWHCCFFFYIKTNGHANRLEFNSSLSDSFLLPISLYNLTVFVIFFQVLFDYWIYTYLRKKRFVFTRMKLASYTHYFLFFSPSRNHLFCFHPDGLANSSSLFSIIISEAVIFTLPSQIIHTH